MAFHTIHCKGMSEEDCYEVYRRQSGLLDFKYDRTVDYLEMAREDPLLKQQSEETTWA